MENTNNGINNSNGLFIENIWEWITDIMIIKEYEINPNDTYWEQTKSFILRYRRIIGIFLLIILIYIWINCDFDNNDNTINNKQQHGGSNNPFSSFDNSLFPNTKPAPAQAQAPASAPASATATATAPEPATAPASAPEPATAPKKPKMSKQQRTEQSDLNKYKKSLEMDNKKADIKKEYEAQKVQKEQEEAAAQAKVATDKRVTDIQSKKVKSKYGLIGIDKRTKEEKAEIKEIKKQGRTDYKQASKDVKQAEKALKGAVTEENKAKAQNALDKAKAVKADKSKALGAKKSSKDYRKSITGSVYGMGSRGVDSIKENAGWFYQILFSIAISLIICIIVIPSISFFFIALICFFLLKYKMSNLKGF